MRRSTGPAGMSGRILDIAERLVQSRGFNAFSYADIAEALKITKASLHYHFPSKAKLGERLLERYRESFLAALQTIDRETSDEREALRRYVRIYDDIIAKDRMCLCGMHAADYATLPKLMRDGVRRFFDANEAWLAALLDRGRTRKRLAFAGSPQDASRAFTGALEGAMLLARSYGDPERFRSAAELLLASFGVKRAR